ncbi:MAG: hypothetical protein KAH20_11470 [Methylococcales bacterium]|nr:hypothetical protein [Methylococcales bacterium]
MPNRSKVLIFYDVTSNSLENPPYISVNGFVTVGLGFAVPKSPTSCLATLNVRGTQIRTSDQINPVTKTIRAGTKPDTSAPLLTLDKKLNHSKIGSLSTKK